MVEYKPNISSGPAVHFFSVRLKRLAGLKIVHQSNIGLIFVAPNPPRVPIIEVHRLLFFQSNRILEAITGLAVGAFRK